MSHAVWPRVEEQLQCHLLGDQQLTEEWSGRRQHLTVSHLSAVFSKCAPDDCGLCLPTWELHIFIRVCACSCAELYPHPPRHYRPHPLKHISDSRLFAHAQTLASDVSETFTDHMRAHTNTDTYTQRSILVSMWAQTHITCGRHTPRRLAVPSPQLNSLFWQSAGQPEHWRQRQAHENTGSLGGLRELCTFSQLCSQVVQPTMSIFLFLFTLICLRTQQ